MLLFLYLRNHIYTVAVAMRNISDFRVLMEVVVLLHCPNSDILQEFVNVYLKFQMLVLLWLYSKRIVHKQQLQYHMDRRSHVVEVARVLTR